MSDDCWRRIRRGAAAMATLLLFLVPPVTGNQGIQKLKETVIPVDGMICSSCAATVEQALRRLAGVEQAQADVKKDAVRVRYNGEKVTLQQMAEAIRKAGYRLSQPGERTRR